MTPAGAYTATPCPSCRTPKPVRHYLCPACWRQLPAAARDALDRRDGQAFARLRELRASLAAGVPLADISITP
ncbi:hypothetical protein VSR01_16530 [Actinacidiphila sp. DG2A-62]|uniref:hypothetical protein n=1 Tax=Actinacidiphila sp. DG2A-62 TaxID=3108821 RepID=UPI002DB98F41|nr:hypothetical protein [Actinacidiphila sp. DG2A-62]MEC3995053.1 hypothetical protein [Actinacidiphila sp. DG2A-62]